MLTETVAGRTFDYSHNVGRGAQTGMGFNTPVAMTIAPDGVVYVANRGSESISNVGWNRTGVGQRISKVNLGATWARGRVHRRVQPLRQQRRAGSSGPPASPPTAMATCYVADEWLNRVSVFDADGNYQRHFSTVPADDAGGERKLRHRYLRGRHPVRNRRAQPPGPQVHHRRRVRSAPSAAGVPARGSSTRPGASRLTMTAMSTWPMPATTGYRS